MRYVIVGASSGVGRALAASFAAAGHDLIVVSSDARDIAATATDLSIRHGRQVSPVSADITNLDQYLTRLERAIADTDGVDGLFLPVGAVLEHDNGELDPAAAEWTMRANFTAVAATVTTMLPYFLARGCGTIAGFGSVAATRGRGSNIIYAASKRALESFFESLRHRCVGTGVVVQFYVLGYLDTALSYGRRTPLRPGAPEALSMLVLRKLGSDVGVVYYPGVWRWVTVILRLLPWPIFKRLSF